MWLASVRSASLVGAGPSGAEKDEENEEVGASWKFW